MKKILVIVLSLILCFGLAGCGQKYIVTDNGDNSYTFGALTIQLESEFQVVESSDEEAGVNDCYVHFSDDKTSLNVSVIDNEMQAAMIDIMESGESNGVVYILESNKTVQVDGLDAIRTYCKLYSEDDELPTVYNYHVLFIPVSDAETYLVEYTMPYGTLVNIGADQLQDRISFK